MVGTVVIGTKEYFGIEYMPVQFQDTQNLRVRLWLNGLPLGTLEEEAYLPTFKSNLSKFVNCPSNTDWSLASMEELKKLLNDGDIDGKNLVTLGETFDDFCIVRFCLEDRIVIVWDLVDSPFFSYPELPVGPFKAEVSCKQISSTVSEFFSRFSNH
jgi:hypothetical protein